MTARLARLGLLFVAILVIITGELLKISSHPGWSSGVPDRGARKPVERRDCSSPTGAPKALVAYPGARATIGSAALEFGVRVPNLGVASSDWVIAKLVVRGRVLDIGGEGSSRWRVVGNDISCPMGESQTACFAASRASNIAFLGNEVHSIRQGYPPLKQYHAVYFTSDTNHVEVGWNHIHDNMTCRAVQFHSSPLCVPRCGFGDTTGFNQYELIVHDNLIHGTVWRRHG